MPRRNHRAQRRRRPTELPERPATLGQLADDLVRRGKASLAVTDRHLNAVKSSGTTRTSTEGDPQ